MVAFRPQLRSRIMQLSVDLLACKHCLWCSNLTWRRLSTTVSSWLSVNNYYELLGVKEDATLEQIKEAFFERSKKLHPDIDLSNPDLHAQFVKLNEAYSVLSKAGSRRRYDENLQLHRATFSGAPFRPYAGTGAKNDPFVYTDLRSRPGSGFEKSEQVRYWEQFRYASPEEYAATRSEKKRRRNMRLLGYCMFIMLGSVVAHYVAFRKLEEVHNNFMDEKDRIITGIYNESKERARVNGFKKQQELLRQKHAEFVEKYRLKHRGTDEK
ncbi:dnaJ homolog subfamily C member 4 [Latimeria chalumnae]|uniref:dnaJ homolog subfamily C member 4 n=1 Tax=Latimeria chalumnae TaxID=7897 RepID=UPI00313C9747